jgi:hypothetical protein
MEQKTYTERVEQIGFVAVDSGQIVITDPANLSFWKDNGFGESEQVGEYSYGGSCDLTLADGFDGQLVFESGTAGAGVVSRTGLGDGLYPVYATIVDLPDWGKRVSKIEIVFIDEYDFDGEDGEEMTA